MVEVGVDPDRLRVAGTRGIYCNTVDKNGIIGKVVPGAVGTKAYDPVKTGEIKIALRIPERRGIATTVEFIGIEAGYSPRRLCPDLPFLS